MNYTEEDLRKLAELIDDAYRPYTTNNVEAHFIIDNFIQNGFEKPEEEKDVPVLFYTIKNKIGWSKWCDVTGGNHYALNEGYSPSDNEVFYCTESQAKELGI